jgi:hypothetical protein
MIHTILVVIFMICEFLAAIGVTAPKVNLMALGFFVFAISLLV